MIFTKYEKSIIKAIGDGSVYDIPSFISEFKCFEVYKPNLLVAGERFKQSGYSATVMAQVHDKNLQGQFVDQLLLTPYLVYDEKLKICYEDDNFEFTLYEEIKICNDYEKVKEFIAIWEYLREQLAIIELEKSIEKDDISWLCRLTCQKEIPERDNKYTPILYKRNVMDATDTIEKQRIKYEAVGAKKFLAEEIELDYENLKVFSKYINKKIVSTAVLKNFIKNDCMTEEQKIAKRSLRAAWVAIVISILTAAFSIYATYNVDPSDYNLRKIQSQINELRTVIEGKDDIENSVIETENKTVTEQLPETREQVTSNNKDSISNKGDQ